MEAVPIEILRMAFTQSAVATMATQVGAYLRLVKHPDAQLIDLLDALDRGPVIADDAALRLHTHFRLAKGVTPALKRSFWEQLFAENKIDPMTYYHERRPGAAPPPAEVASG